MKYLLHKHTFCDGLLYPNQERPDVVESLEEAIVTFKEAFKHLTGKKATEKQVERIKSFDVVKCINKSLEYRFCLTKQED